MFARLRSSPIGIGALVVLVVVLIYAGWRLIPSASSSAPVVPQSTPIEPPRPWNIPGAPEPTAPPSQLPPTPAIVPEPVVPPSRPSPIIDKKTKYVIIRKDARIVILPDGRMDRTLGGFVLARVRLTEANTTGLFRDAFTNIAFTQGSSPDNPWTLVDSDLVPVTVSSEGRQEITMTLRTPADITHILVMTNDSSATAHNPRAPTLAGTSIILLNKDADILWTGQLAPVATQMLTPTYSGIQGFANDTRSMIRRVLRRVKLL